LQSVERLLDAMQMGMFTTGHAFIFRSLQRALVLLSGSENGSFLAGRNVGCLDYIHGALEPARLVEQSLIGMHLIMHVVLLRLLVLRACMLGHCPSRKALILGLARLFLITYSPTSNRSFWCDPPLRSLPTTREEMPGLADRGVVPGSPLRAVSLLCVERVSITGSSMAS